MILDYIEKEGYLWVETVREFDKFSNFLNNFIKGKIPDNLSINNISIAFKTMSSSGKKAIYILKNMVLQFYI